MRHFIHFDYSKTRFKWYHHMVNIAQLTVFTFVIIEIMALSGCSPLGSNTVISSPKSQNSCLLKYRKCMRKIITQTLITQLKRKVFYPNSPRVSATINLMPLLWQKSPMHICSSRLELVSTTTWSNTQTPVSGVFWMHYTLRQSSVCLWEFSPCVELISTWNLVRYSLARVPV